NSTSQIHTALLRLLPAKAVEAHPPPRRTETTQLPTMERRWQQPRTRRRPPWHNAVCTQLSRSLSPPTSITVIFLEQQFDAHCCNLHANHCVRSFQTSRQADDR